MTIHKDRWLLQSGGRILEMSPSELAARIAEDIANQTIPDGTL
jgi:hypothetical protein